MEELMSYGRFLKDIQSFKKASTNNGDVFNIYDTPSHKFFKILFYFENGDSNGLDDNSNGSSSGLLAPTWNYIKDDKYYNYNSAWAYLKLNDENERAEKLIQFVTLLSDINSRSPWYFNSIAGLDEALDRKIYENDFKIEEERKKISIKCLPDAFDNRIGTLLDLYRDIIWSWSMKREVIPANLRKFDMGIYIFESNAFPYSENTNFNESLDGYTSSYKLLEFHNCEFDMNSSKSGYSEINNGDGVQQEYSIDIYYDDCYERRYNEIMMRTIGDVIVTDTQNNIRSIAQGAVDSFLNNSFDISKKDTELSNKVNYFDYKEPEPEEPKKIKNIDKLKQGAKDFVKGASTELIGAVERLGKSVYNKIVLGNLHGISPIKVKQQVESASEGHVMTTIYTAKDYARKLKQKNNKVTEIGNIFKASTLANNL